MGRFARTAGIVVILLVLSLVPLWFISGYGRAIKSDHSRFAVSDSAADARARGVYLRSLEIDDSTVRWRGRQLRVREAWIEERTQVKYFLLLPGTRHIVRRGDYYLAFTLIDERGRLPEFGDRIDLIGDMCILAAGVSPRGAGNSAGPADPFVTEAGRDPPTHLRIAATVPPCPAHRPVVSKPPAR